MKNRKLSNFAVGIISLIISQIFIKIFGVAYTLYLTNKKGFGDEGNAIYMSGYQIYALLLTVSSIGVPNAIAKLISEKNSIRDYINKNRILKISLFIFGIIGFSGCMVLYLGANFISINILDIPDSNLGLMVLSPAIFFVAINSVLRGYFNGEGKIGITAKSQVVEQIAKSVLTIVLVEVFSRTFENNVKVLAAFANLATTIATFISFTYLIYRYKNLEKAFNKNIFEKERIFYIFKKVLKCSVPITLCSIFAVIGKSIDSITVVRILKRFIDEKEAISKYGILSSKVDTLIALPLAFNNSISTSLIPEISKKKSVNDIKGVANKIESSLILCLMICIPYSFGVFFYSNEIFDLLFPRASSGAELLKIASFYLTFSALTQIMNSSLHGLEKSSFTVYASVISVVIKIVFNIVLIPINGVLEKGAIFANIISNVFTFIIVSLYLKKNINIKIKTRYIIFPFFASSFMIFSSKIFNIVLNRLFLHNKILTAFTICFSVVIYCFCIIFVKIFKKIKNYRNLENSDLQNLKNL